MESHDNYSSQQKLFSQAGSPDNKRTENPDNTKTESSDNNRTENPDSTRIGSPDSRRTGSPDDTRTGSPGSSRSGSPDSSRSGSPDSSRSGSPDSSRSGSQDSSRTGSLDSSRTGSPDNSRTGSSESSRTLQDLPLELLDMILMKAVLRSRIRVKKSRRYQPIDLIKKKLGLLMTVWSEWCCRLNTNWFKIEFRRQCMQTYTHIGTVTGIEKDLRATSVRGYSELLDMDYMLVTEEGRSLLFVYDYDEDEDFEQIHTISLAKIIPLVYPRYSCPREDVVISYP